MPNADLSHAVVARCLTDPDFLLAVQSLSRGESLGVSSFGERELRQAIELLPATELERLWRFRGFITKIKHNGLRPILPATLAILSRLGEEIGAFASYSPAYAKARASGPLSIDRQIELFSAHMTDYLDAKDADVARLLTVVMTHEILLFRVGRASVDPSEMDVSAISLGAPFAVRSYPLDVLGICTAVRDGDHTFLDRFAVDRQVLVYVHPQGADRPSVFEVDELTGLILTLVDGRRRLEDVARELEAATSRRVSDADLVAFFDDVHRLGFTSNVTLAGRA